MKLVHIIPHCGGGAGKVLRNLLSGLAFFCPGEFENRLCLFEHADDKTKDWARTNGIPLCERISPTSPVLNEMVEKADICQIHFWNHPSIYHFYAAVAGKRARWLQWAYVNGGNHCAATTQGFTEACVSFGNNFTVSTPASLSSPALEGHDVSLVFMSAGIDGFIDVQPLAHPGFRLCYVGTVESSKMHEGFLKLARSLCAPGRSFVVAGGAQHASLAQKARLHGISDFLEVRGPVARIAHLLAASDCFAYPLAADHYGTGEQALIEAMCAGLPQVVYANGPEKCIVRDGITGMIASSPEEFAQHVDTLENNPNLRHRMASASRIYAQSAFGLETVIRSWQGIYQKSMRREKESCSFVLKDTYKTFDFGAKSFLASIAKEEIRDLYVEIFQRLAKGDAIENDIVARHVALPPIFHCKTRGSVRHYARWFGESPLLCAAARQLNLFKPMEEQWHD